MVADVLRDRILSGELADGALIPKQEDLLEEFRVSLASAREALRILETEGLIAVQRGNVGGAVVHRPQPGKVAYMLALVLQSRAVTLADVSKAMGQIEPVCAAACAAREDRAESVLPQLRETLDAALEAVGDTDEYTSLARKFHVDLVAACGNETMILVVGALESLWTAHVGRLARASVQRSSFADERVRRGTVKEHERIYREIAKGDARAAQRAAEAHYGLDHTSRAGRHHGFDLSTIVEASFVHD